MKFKLIILVVLVVFAQVLNAQTFGIKGGVNLANMNISASGMSISPKSIIGVHFGPVVDFKVKENLYFNTGLLYSLKGMKISSNGVSGSEKLNYLEIPLNVAYKFSLNETSNFFVEAGPYLAYALSGKDKTGSTTEDVVFGGADNNKRFDFGLGFGPGVQFGPMVASVNYQIGLVKVVDGQDYKVTNKVLQLSVAYMFGK